MNILVLNAGSSSQKISFFKIGAGLPEVPQKPDWEAKLDVKWQEVESEKWIEMLKERLSGLAGGPEKLINSLSEISVVGHRIVHGGTKYLASTKINAQVKADIENLEQLAPLHNKINLTGINAMEQLLSEKVEQVAVFDTAFHRTLPLYASLYPVPYQWYEDLGIHKFGFHGINHQYCAKRAAQMLAKPLESLSMIVCHLGSGCSLSAVENGKSVDTTMGFTPLEGLMMSTRSGTIDPGLLIYLLRNSGMSAEKLDDVLNHDSGLKGISGLSSDLAIVINEMKKGNQRAKLAFDMYVYRICRYVAEMRAALKRLDCLVFTAGVGENAPLVRQSVCGSLNWLGVQIDSALNESTRLDGNIGKRGSSVPVLVISAREDWAIASDCWQILSQSPN
ncbi:MAG: acetate kinase [Candidatus Melainabacteria bacterium]|nr:MAG: acetate kinase [Candidatus Melainabacteria bacterium]